MDARPVHEELVRDASAAGTREARVQEVGERLPLVPPEVAPDAQAARPDAAVVVLAQRVVVGDAGLFALRPVEAREQSLGELVHARELAAARRRQQPVARGSGDAERADRRAG